MSVNAIAIDKVDRIWVCTRMPFIPDRGYGVYVLNSNGSFTHFMPGSCGLISITVNAIAVGPSQNIWFGSDYGVDELNFLGPWNHYSKSDSGLASDKINAIKADLTDRIWFGTDNGVSMLDTDGSWVNYNKALNGLTSDNILSIEVDSLNRIWLGTDNGLSVLDADGSCVNYTAENSGLANNHVNAIAIDPYNRKWFATDDGVSSLIQESDTPKVNIYANQRTYEPGEVVEISVDVDNPARGTVKMYTAAYIGGEFYWHPTWTDIPFGTKISPGNWNEVILDIPAVLVSPGTYRFYSALITTYGFDLLGMDSVSITVQ